MTTQELAAPARACPLWCDRTAHEPTGTLSGDPLIHTQESLDVAVSLDGAETFLRLGLTRLDDDGQAGAPHIGMALNDGWLIAGCGYDEELRMTPAQARAFATVLNRLADQGEQS